MISEEQIRHFLNLMSLKAYSIKIGIRCGAAVWDCIQEEKEQLLRRDLCE